MNKKVVKTKKLPVFKVDKELRETVTEGINNDYS